MFVHHNRAPPPGYLGVHENSVRDHRSNRAVSPDAARLRVVYLFRAAITLQANLSHVQHEDGCDKCCFRCGVVVVTTVQACVLLRFRW